GKRLTEYDKAVQMARSWLKAGKILAIKGLGGFHLACDAANPQAMNNLRLRKHRTDKPFALMAYDLKTISQYCDLTDTTSKLLQSPQAPIILLPIRRDGIPIADNTAPHQKRLGFMLPYTPLHLLLLEPEQDYPRVLVMTSANISDEPIAYQNNEARLRLSKLADGFLMHDRPIYIRADDSVFAQLDHKPYPIRRARGFAPNPIRVVQNLPNILGTGPQLKNTFCLSRDHYAFLSHYIGDLENYETLQAYENAITHYEKLFRIKPEIIAYDMHPDYLSTRYAINRAQEENIPLIPVQHHHAHIAACLTENKWESSSPVIGLSFDGTGYGIDGHIWGGEVLIAGYNEFKRRYHLAEVPMPGGDRAVVKPTRMALSYLITSNIALDPDLPPIKSLKEMEIDVIKHQIKNNINTPLTSSMGRLFDAVAALLGIRQEVNYEAQAAIELEAIADPHEKGYYILDIDGHTIHTQALFEAIVTDMQNKVSNSKISAKFHQSIINMALDICNIIRKETGIQHVALSGGVWQNLYLMSHIIPALEKAQFILLVHQQTPPNDGCVALGQVMIAAHQVNH
ncbi:MAG: carbamoyltransferase HypF, partial [Chloroflexota bacterium]